MATVDLTGRLRVLGPDRRFSISDLPDDWFALGANPARHAQVAVIGERRSVRISSGPKPYALLRRVDASLLATPYLSWSWRVEAGASDIHPARLTIGLIDSPTDDHRWRLPAGLGLGQGLPRFDRTITIAWGSSALMRGSMTRLAATSSHPESVRYVVRGGQENTARWWRETVDLSDIHARTWPDIDRDRSRIVFIGITAAAGPTRETANFAAIQLSR